MTQLPPDHPKTKRPNRYKKSKKQPTDKVVKPSYIHEPSRDADGGFRRDAYRIANARHDLDRMELMLRDNHHAILMCAELLNVSQPPMSGKIEVRWWKKDGDDMTRPVVVQWGVNGLTRPIPWKGLRLKCNSRGKFKINIEQTMRLLGALEELLTAREFMLKKLKYLTQERKKAERYHATLVDYKKRDQFNVISQQIAENERNATKERNQDSLSTHRTPKKSE